jgi:hypothetical protein
MRNKLLSICNVRKILTPLGLDLEGQGLEERGGSTRVLREEIR